MGRASSYMGPNEYDASKERRALNHLLQEKLSRAQTAGNWARCWCILARILTRGLTVKFQGSVSASEPRAASRSDTRSILCRYASVQRMREVAGEFVAVELDSRHSADVYPECARVCVCVYLSVLMYRGRGCGAESERDSLYSKTEEGVKIPSHV